jgi:hypothetical protein
MNGWPEGWTPVLTSRCAGCRRVKLDGTYVSLGLRAVGYVTDGVCQPCIRKLYPGLRRRAA